MTDDLGWPTPLTPANPAAPASRKCSRHLWDAGVCARCDRVKDETVAKRNKNNKSRGGREEATIAMLIGGRKVGPMGWPWDVETNSCRLQVKKLAERPSLNAIGDLILAIPFRTDSLRGFVWSKAGGRGKRTERQVYVVRNEWVEWHGYEFSDSLRLISMDIQGFVDIHCEQVA